MDPWKRASPLEERFSYVSNEEDRKAVLRRTISADFLALKIEFKNFNTSDGGQFINSNKKGETDSQWSDYCNKLGHTRQTCWKLNGKPSNRTKGIIHKGKWYTKLWLIQKEEIDSHMVDKNFTK